MLVLPGQERGVRAFGKAPLLVPTAFLPTFPAVHLHPSRQQWSEWGGGIRVDLGLWEVSPPSWNSFPSTSPQPQVKTTDRIAHCGAWCPTLFFPPSIQYLKEDYFPQTQRDQTTFLSSQSSS